MKISHGSIQQLDKTKPRNKCRKWRLTCSVDGHRVQKRFTGSISEAKKALEEWRAELSTDSASGIMFGEYAARWRDTRKASGRLSTSTITNDASAVRYLLQSPLKDKPLDCATLDDCEEAMIWVQTHPRGRVDKLSGSTLKQVHVRLRSIYLHAELSGLVRIDPTRHLKAPRIDTEEKTALEPERIEAVLDALDEEPIDGFVMVVYLMLCLGLRRGEALALSFDDIRDGTAHVHKAYNQSTKTMASTKTAAGSRALPMPHRLKVKLREWTTMREEIGIADAPTIACRYDGQPISVDAMGRWWRDRRDALGCSGFTLHQLRHSNLSMMARVVPSAYDLQRWAGWSDISPARVYIHDSIDALQAAADAVLMDKTRRNCST